MTQKGMYPYDYINTIEQLFKMHVFNRNSFYSKLNETNMKESDSLHAKLVFYKSNCKHILDYHNLYLTCAI